MPIILSNVILYLHSTGHDCHNYIDDLSTIVSFLNDQFGSIPYSKSITAKHNN